MTRTKERTKGILRRLGLYEWARTMWLRRPDWQVACWNAGYRIGGAPDKLPIPPTRLIYLVTISKEISWYLQSGYIGHQSILHILVQNGLRVEEFNAILDFGCGCGRLIRQWPSLNGRRLYGTDYNPELIHWCQKQLGAFAEFNTNELSPPLDYEDEKFDFIYCISVFTHLTEDLQSRWMAELARVLKPNGILLITVHGASRLHELDPQEQERFAAGQLVVKREFAAGTNACGAYHPERYVRDRLAQGFEVVDFVPRGARDTNQDVFLLRRLGGIDGTIA